MSYFFAFCISVRTPRSPTTPSGWPTHTRRISQLFPSTDDRWRGCSEPLDENMSGTLI